jgi:hypothetical protein
MDGRHNLFEYADRELSQDGFLLWLLNNFDSEEEDVRFFSNGFIAALCGPSFPKEVKITAIETWAQWKKIDVLAEITLGNGEKHLLAIEDKTFSEVHNRRGKDKTQLAYYNRCIKEKMEELSVSEKHSHKIFYKTSLVSEEEKNEVKAAEWQWLDLEGIKGVFEELSHNYHEAIKNAILLSYIDHLKKLDGLIYHLADDTQSWGKVGWGNYITQNWPSTIDPQDDPRIRWCGSGYWHGTYAWLVFVIKSPSLEGIYNRFFSKAAEKSYLHIQLSMEFRFSQDGKDLWDVRPKLRIRKAFPQEEGPEKHQDFNTRESKEDKDCTDEMLKLLELRLSSLFDIRKWKKESYQSQNKLNTTTASSFKADLDKYIRAINEIHK